MFLNGIEAGTLAVTVYGPWGFGNEYVPIRGNLYINNLDEI